MRWDVSGKAQANGEYLPVGAHRGEAENLVLRQQLNVLMRKLPRRLLLRNSDRLLGLAVMALSFDFERHPDRQARNRNSLAPSRVSSLLALEISFQRRPATDRPVRCVTCDFDTVKRPLSIP